MLRFSRTLGPVLATVMQTQTRQPFSAVRSIHLASHVAPVQPRHAWAVQRSGRALRTAHAVRALASAAGSSRTSSSAAVSPADEELPFTVYTPTANAEYWGTRPVAVTRRALQICAALGSWLMEGRVTNRGASRQELTDVRADKLRHLLTELGPAFVKIGQAVSSRPDVAPPEFLRELEKLQDQIPPFPNDQAFEVLQSELGAPVNTIFSTISPDAVAAASLGQVYRAVLRSTGEAVAVKVQRPGVASSIALDVFVLRQLLAFVRRWRKFNSDLPALLDEWASSLFRELDYRHEAANGVRFRELYGHMEDVYVPRMHTALCTRKVLVMEWVDGERLRTAYSAAREAGAGASTTAGPGSSSSSMDDLRLVEVGVRCSLEQMLEEGFYHADPHPGNLLKTKDGKLAYLDFGMMGQVDATIRRGLMRATLHLVNREFEALADDFVTLGMLPKTQGDEKEREVVPALTGVFAEALRGGVSNLSFGELSGQLGRTMYQFHFQIPPYYTLLVRSLSVLEGIALASDRDYKVLGAAYPWIARRLLTDTTPELRSTLMALLYKDGVFNFRRMESLISQAVRPTGRPQPRRNVQPGQSAVQRGDALALLLSPEGEFVRGIVTEELAKGIDAAWRLAADTAVGTARQQLLEVSLDTRQALGSASGGSLLVHALAEALSTLPRLSDERDQEQVEGITRLARVLQESTAGQRQQAGGDWFQEAAAGSGGPATPWETAYSSLSTAAAILQWVVVEAETLSPAERAEALRMPITIGQAVASRAAARAIRWVLVGEALFNSSFQAGAASSTSTATGTDSDGSSRQQQSGGRSGAAPGSSSMGGEAPVAARVQPGGSSSGSSSSSSSSSRGQAAAAMRPLTPSSSSSPSTSSSSSRTDGTGSGGSSISGAARPPSYRAGSAGSSVIVRPTATAAGPATVTSSSRAASSTNMQQQAVPMGGRR